MDRRNFLRSTFLGGIGLGAARQWPFRVFSFPSEIKVVTPVIEPAIYTTYWAPIEILSAGGVPVGKKWLGEWEFAGKKIPLHQLPELSDAAFANLKALAEKSGFVNKLSYDNFRLALEKGQEK